MKRNFFIIIGLAMFTLPQLAIGKDAIALASEISRQVESHFYSREFSAINKLENEFRRSQSRLPDGRWKLTFIYNNIVGVSRRGAKQEWKLKFQIMDAWIKTSPSEAAPYLAKADALISYAWDARGSSLSPERKNLFRQRIQMARETLENSAGFYEENPYWYLKMEVIAKAQSWSVEDFIRLYQKAVTLFPTYYFIHFRAADYFQPRWYGSKQKLSAFVNAAVEQSKSLEGLTLYTRIYWSQLWALRDNTFSPGYAQWDKMKQGFEDIMNQFPESIWNLNAYAYYSCMAHDWQTSKQLLAKIGNQPHLGIWRSKSRYYSCKAAAEGKNRPVTPGSI